MKPQEEKLSERGSVLARVQSPEYDGSLAFGTLETICADGASPAAAWSSTLYKSAVLQRQHKVRRVTWNTATPA